MIRFVAAAIALGRATVVTAAPIAVPMQPDRWETDGSTAFETVDGRMALRLGMPPGQKRGGGLANVKGLDFATGVIEFDMRLPVDREFSGPSFRQANNMGEVIYFRPHLNGKPDAIQYTPVVNGNLAWQIFTGPGFEAEVSYPLGRWFHVRTDVYVDSAQVTVDGKPFLHVPDLKNSIRTGALGFVALAGPSYFANLSFEAIADYRDPAPAQPARALPSGAVTRWQVSPSLTRDQAMVRAAARNWAGLGWTRIDVESNGIANLSKAGPDADDRHSFVARFTVESRSARTVPMPFGFSDQVRIFLNGKPLYEGADLQFSRDYRFLGHVGFWDTVFLPLVAGRNDVAFVVTDETNGGTAAAAIIDAGPEVMVR